MTILQQTCAEMASAQFDQQHLHRVAHAMNTKKVPRTPMNVTGLSCGYAICESALGAIASRMTRFAAANDNTMVVGVA
jgi:hypothetical protein